MKALLASAAIALLVSGASLAQAAGMPPGGGAPCGNVLKPECSKSPGAPSGHVMHHRHHRMHHRHHRHHGMRHHPRHHHMMKKH
jgi:hypothetical protein